MNLGMNFGPQLSLLVLRYGRASVPIWIGLDLLVTVVAVVTYPFAWWWHRRRRVRLTR
jgi:hypothetical protein